MRTTPFFMPSKQREQSDLRSAPFFNARLKGKRTMKKDIKLAKTKMVRLLKWINGAWQVVDYGVPSKADAYAAMGYLVEQESGIKEV